MFRQHFVDSVAPLGISQTFTGEPRRTSIRSGRVGVYAFASHAGTAELQQSHDGNAWRFAVGHSIAVGAGETRQLVVDVVAPFWRVVYVNGAAAQTTFVLMSAELA